MGVTYTEYPSPNAAAIAVLTCLSAAWTNDAWEVMTKYVGPRGTGHTLDCCPSGVIRVEFGPLYAEDGPVWLGKPNGGCVDLVQSIEVIYRECYTAVAKDGKRVSFEKLQASGAQLSASAWAA